MPSITENSSFNIENVVRPHILALQQYSTSTSDEYEARAMIMLDANENALGSCLSHHSSLGQHQIGRQDFQSNGKGNPDYHSNGVNLVNGSRLLVAETGNLHRYPSASQIPLKQTIARWRGLSDSHWQNICLGIGAADLVDLIIRVTCRPVKDSVLITPPTFGLYKARAALNEAQVVENPLRVVDDDFALNVPELLGTLACNHNVKVVFLASPGNPTGTLIPLSEIERVLQFSEFKGILVVDEAYIDFSASPKASSALRLLPKYPNLVVLQTLSKSHGLAGIRLGMAFGDSSVIRVLNKMQMPFCIPTPVSTLALHALSPQHDPVQEYLTAQTIANREVLLAALKRPEIIKLGIGKPLGGNSANFIVLPVFTVGDEKTIERRDVDRARKVCTKLRLDHSISVRFIGEMVGCEGCLRITVGTEDENDQLVRKLSKALKRCR